MTSEYLLAPDNRDLSRFPGEYGWPFLGKTLELVKKFSFKLGDFYEYFY